MRDQVDQARWIAVLAVTAIALYLCWLMLRPFMGVLAWAGVLVVVFYPVHRRIAERTQRRSLSALISCLLVVLVVVLPLTLSPRQSFTNSAKSLRTCRRTFPNYSVNNPRFSVESRNG